MDDQRIYRQRRADTGRREAELPEREAAGSRRGRTRKEKKRHRKYVILLCAEIFAVVLVSFIAYFFFYIKSKYDVMTVQGDLVSFAREDVHTNAGIEKKIEEINESYTMIMAYGVDARNNKDLLQDANADTDIIICINNQTYEVKMVSVLRDTLLSRTNGKYKKLTDIYAGWGVKESLDTINMNLDLNITQYVTVNWKALVRAIDILGGIDMEVTAKEIKQINNFGVEVAKITGYTLHEMDPDDEGLVHLDGVQAVAYARIRNVTVNGEGHDIGRATRQRKVIKAMLTEAKGASLSDLDDLLSEVLPMAATNISFSEALAMAADVTKYTITDNTCWPFEYIDQQDLRTAYVYCNTLEQNVSELHAFLFGDEGYEPSSTVKSISDYIVQYAAENP